MFSNRRRNLIVLAVLVVAIAAAVVVGTPYDRFNWSDSVFAQDGVPYPGASEPGCQIDIPAGSVVGAFLADTPLYWTPEEGGTSGEYHIGHTAKVPKTAWVIGQDESEQYYKIVWSCQYLWVPKDTMGPNFDEVWEGTPLPTRIVD